MSDEKEKLYRNKVEIITRGYDPEDAEENLKKGIIFVDDVLEYWEEEKLSHLDHDLKAKERISKSIWRKLKR